MAIAFSHAGSAQGKGVTTLSATVTINAGDTSIIAISVHANTSPSSVFDSGGSVYKFRQAVNNGTTDRIELWSTDAGAAKASTSVTVQFAASTTYVIAVATYTGVLGLGAFTDVGVNTNTGASTAPSVQIILKDPNNWAVMASANDGVATYSATAPTTVRASNATSGGSAATNQGGAIIDSGAIATIGTDTVTGTLSVSETWATAGIELRGVSLAYSYLCGFEMNSVGEFNTTGGTAPTIQSATVHGGSFAMRCHPTAAASFAQFRQFKGGATQAYPLFCSVRFYINIAVLPNVNTQIYSGGTQVATGYQTLQLNTDGSLTILDGAGASASSGSLKLSLNTWHQISLAVNPTDGSNFISVTVDGVLWAQLTSTSGNTAVYVTAQLGVGVLNTSTPTCDIYFDDVLWANDFAVIGAGQQVLLLPTADSAIGNWTTGSGGVTNLFNAVKNIPPIGKAAGSETNTSQIRNPNATVPSDYTATCQSYTAGGIAAGSTINAVTGIVSDGVEVAAATFGFVFVASNPTQTAPPTQFEFTYGGGATQGTFPTAWATDEGPVSTNPSPTLGTATTATVRKSTNVTSADNACFLGIYVDYLTPSATDKVHNVDCVVQVTQNKIHNVDCYVQALQSKTHNVDCDVKADQSKTHNVDCVVRVDQSKTHNVDCVVQTTSSLVHNVDCVVQVDQSKTHNVDCYVQTTTNKTHNVDCDVQQDTSKVHNVDCDVQEDISKTHNVDCYVLISAVTTNLLHNVDCFVLVSIPPVSAALTLEEEGFRIKLFDYGDGTTALTVHPVT
jgi:hypothetical protein